MKKLKIGVDFHGVITADPLFFSCFNRYALEKGHAVYVLSGGYRKDIEDYLNRFDVPYTDIWSMVDYFEKKRRVIHLSDGTFRVPDKQWNEAKARYCLENGIDFHIDDSQIYGDYFQIPFCLYNALEKSCKICDCVIDFSDPAQKVFDKIEDMFKDFQPEN